jgi:hypothetical protein
MRIERRLLFGNAAEMGTDADIERELREAAALEKAAAKEEKDRVADEDFQKKMAARGMRGIKKIKAG